MKGETMAECGIGFWELVFGFLCLVPMGLVGLALLFIMAILCIDTFLTCIRA
jgi:hypothetical protein